MNLKIKKLKDDAVMPTRAHHDDAGIDIYTNEEVTIKAGETKKVGTGIAVAVPSSYVGLVWDKSSIGSKGIKTLGGVLDAQYRGEIFVVLHNLSKEPVTFKAGDKIAQLLIQKVELLPVEEVEELDETDRGEGGFGSTGR
jgi:dUTP pyrophosphatase